MSTIYYTAATLDGFLATPDHRLDWLFEVPGADAAEEAIPDFTGSVGALVMGSSTYEWVVRQENLLEHPQRWREWYGDRPTWVFTTRSLPVVEGADIRFTRTPVVELLPRDIRSDRLTLAGVVQRGQFAELTYDVT